MTRCVLTGTYGSMGGFGLWSTKQHKEEITYQVNAHRKRYINCNNEPYIDTIYGQTKCSRRRVFKIRQTMHAREAREDYENQ